MILKTEAIVLRIAPFSRTSHIVTWMTQDYGKIATVVKGAVRPKSMFLGQYDQFYSCELLFYKRARNNLHIIKETTPLKTRSSFRQDWRAMGVASYLCDLVNRVSPDNDPYDSLYPILEESLDMLAQHSAEPDLVFWTEIRIMNKLGITPQFASCPACRKPISETSSRIGFSSSRGGILCPSCAKDSRQPTSTARYEALKALRYWQTCSDLPAPTALILRASDYVDIQAMLGSFMRYHLDMPLYSRQIAIKLLLSSLQNETVN